MQVIEEIDMANKIELIRSIIEYHHVVRKYVGTVGQSLNDVEAIFTLKSQYASWMQTPQEELRLKMEKFAESIDVLEKGLVDHFNFEEENLPDILGEVLMKGLLYEHDIIKEALKALRRLLNEPRISKLDRDEIYLVRSKFQQALDNLTQHIEKHVSVEEVVLQLAIEGAKK